MKLKRKINPSPSAEAGFTIIESLLAVIVVGILIVAIGPVIALSAATRVQARRVEWATQAARAYLDDLRSSSENDGNIHETGLAIQQIAANSARDYANTLNAVAAPIGGALNCNGKANDYCTGTPADYSFYCIDGDKDGSCTSDNLRDFIVQAAAVQSNAFSGVDADERYKEGYLLLLRVYRADGFADGGTFSKTTAGARSAKAQTFSGGLGDRKAPVLETIITIPGRLQTYTDLCSQTTFGGNNPCDD